MEGRIIKFINPHKLPTSIADAIKWTQSQYDNGGSDISASSINTPPRIYWLTKRYSDKIPKDVRALYRSFIGSAAHYFCEQAAKADKDIIAEERYFKEIDGWKVSAQIDRYNTKTKTLTDLKFSSIYSLSSIPKEDYVAQLNTQRYLLHEHGLEVEKMELDISAVDWYESRAIQKDYPKSPSKSIKVDMWPLEKTEKFIRNKIAELKSYKNTSDDELPMCSDSDKWKKSPTFAVKKKGGSRAVNGGIHSNPIEAEIHARQIGGYVETREAEETRCISYCDVCTKCSHWIKNYGDK